MFNAETVIKVQNMKIHAENQVQKLPEKLSLFLDLSQLFHSGNSEGESLNVDMPLSDSLALSYNHRHSTLPGQTLIYTQD